MVQRLVSPTGRPIPLDPVHPNQGIEAAYRRRLERLVAEMHASILYWLTAAYRANTPEMTALAQDESPAASMRGTMRKMARRWEKNFDEGSAELAKWFATAAADRSDKALQATLRKAGFSVKFKLTDAANDALQATTFENVALIKSIASQHLAEVEGLVMRSVSAGRDLKMLTDDLVQRYEITRRRAAFIARDQNGKATATITRVRQQSLGISEAIWLHSRAGKEPRPSHVEFNGQKYDPLKGALLDGVWTWPGHEINCKCVSKSVIPGF